MPSASSAAGNLDNRHVEIVCAASAHVNVSVLYQFVDTGHRPWPTGIVPRGGLFPGRAARGPVAPRKMACRPAAGVNATAVQGHQLAHRGGAAWSLPLSKREREWTPRRATSLCSPSCRCSAQSRLGRGIETFLARCFLPSEQSRWSAQPIGSGADSRHAKGKAPLSGLIRFCLRWPGPPLRDAILRQPQAMAR